VLIDVVELLTLAHQLLRFSGVIPEVGIFGAGVQLFETFQGR
jgi:hypothetical protein